MARILRLYGVLLLLLISSCSRTSDSWPGRNWKTSSHDKQGFSEERLAAIGPYISEKYPGTSSVLVIHSGYIIYERYFEGDKDTLHDLSSAAKSIVSALTGIVINQNLITDVNEKLVAYGRN